MQRRHTFAAGSGHKWCQFLLLDLLNWTGAVHTMHHFTPLSIVSDPAFSNNSANHDFFFAFSTNIGTGCPVQYLASY